MTKGFKKFVGLGIAVMLLVAVGLSGCERGYSVYHFDDLTDLQAAMRDNVYFFNFEGVDFNEVGEFRAFKRSMHRQEEPWFFRYSIRGFEVRCEVLDRAFPFEVAASYELRPVVVESDYSLDHTYSNGISKGFRHLVRERQLVAIVSFRNEAHHSYFYYFFMNSVQQTLCQDELQFFSTMVDYAISSRHTIQ